MRRGCPASTRRALRGVLAPDSGRAASGKDEHQSLVHVVLGVELPARRDLDYEGIVFMLLSEVQVGALPTFAGPCPQLHRVHALDVVGLVDGHALLLLPLLVRAPAGLCCRSIELRGLRHSESPFALVFC